MKEPLFGMRNSAIRQEIRGPLQIDWIHPLSFSWTVNIETHVMVIPLHQAARNAYPECARDDKGVFAPC